ncbi:PASTA domain-containing protein [Terrilactibacillus sp. S3-3]|nr:PASTA domain-containing protein [Terrilactibacillus sp. S3-3]
MDPIFYHSITLISFSGIVSAFAVFPKLFYVNNVMVPDVTDQTYKQAADILHRHHLKAERRSETNEKIKKGLVIRQNPGKNAEVKEQTSVTLYVSTGPKKVKVDNYVGYDRDSLMDSIDQDKYKKVVWHKETSASVQFLKAKSWRKNRSRQPGCSIQNGFGINV